MATSAWGERIYLLCDNNHISSWVHDQEDYLKELKRDTSFEGLEIPDLNKLYVLIDETGSGDGWWETYLHKDFEEGEVIVENYWYEAVDEYWELERVNLKSKPIGTDPCLFHHELNINRQTLELRHTYYACGRKPQHLGSCDVIKKSEFFEKQLQVTTLASLTSQREKERIVEQDKKLEKAKKF